MVVAACGSDDDVSVEPRLQDRPAESLPTSSSTTTTPPDDGHRIEVAATGGEPEGGVRTEAVGLGERVVLVVTSDLNDEVHVHGYDLTVDLVPGEPATLSFTADKPGAWEVELHEADNLLLELQVT